MSHYLVRQIRDTANIAVRPNTVVVEAAGGEHLERLRLCDTAAGSEEEVAAAYLFVFIGAAPCTGWLDGTIQRDPRGFVVTGPDLLVGGRRPRGWPLDRDPYYLEANVPGVFAAGDARANSVKRVASAVGEGAMAIQLVHRYLEAP
jgi:thioredoxin reductase (NADPH)